MPSVDADRSHRYLYTPECTAIHSVFLVGAGTQKASAAVQEKERLRQEILRLTGDLLRAQAGIKQKKVLQQRIRRLKARLSATKQLLARKFSENDLRLLEIIKKAEAMLREQHPEKFVDVFRKLAQAILDDKLPLDSIELEFICNLARNLAKEYTNQFSYTDNIMRFCAAMIKLQSGKAVLQLFLAASPDNGPSSAPRVKETRRNWMAFPAFNSVTRWEVTQAIDPTFTVGISEAIIKHIQDNTEGILRLGCDATDSHGVAAFLKGGKFEKGDVIFPGSEYDRDKVEEEYGKIARLVEKYANNPSNIESASEGELARFLVNCKQISTFLEEAVVKMRHNLSILQDKTSRSKAEYLRRQVVRANKKKATVKAGEGNDKTKAGASSAKGGNKADEDSVSDHVISNRAHIVYVCGDPMCTIIIFLTHVYSCAYFGCV
jgi:hypothetical protein